MSVYQISEYRSLKLIVWWSGSAVEAKVIRIESPLAHVGRSGRHQLDQLDFIRYTPVSSPTNDNLPRSLEPTSEIYIS